MVGSAVAYTFLTYGVTGEETPSPEGLSLETVTLVV
jgi:hypothetical protein